MTLKQVIRHSPAQLALYIEAVKRKKAGDALLTIKAVYPSMAAVMCEKGGRVLDKAQSELIRQAKGNG
jgi:hypothetical protein